MLTGDETWCNHFEPSKQAVETSPPPKESKRPCTPVLVRLCVWDVLLFGPQGPLLLVEFLERETITYAQLYQTTLQKLRRAIKSQHPGMLSNGIILLHDNAHPHTASALKTTLHQLRWETLEHLPQSPVSE
ncbi:mariner Mos1 transposase [Trichonephila clavata]|uniref:Mariner Mos1 transposase n=1 Tax=Trichonephila clavata TaxID=2740835 RepID=A0A8X6GK32_TRICU|nr:mariner Mos1 transposase [Trichonephila clavata]